MSVIIWLDFSIRHLCNYPGGRGVFLLFFVVHIKQAKSSQRARDQRARATVEEIATGTEKQRKRLASLVFWLLSL